MVLCGERAVPAEWRDATLVPVPKKGDLSVCDNWRGISFLDVMGKLFARIINDRLQAVVENSVADSQCGVRAGRGYVDMVFCVRQLVEKIIAKFSSCLLIFPKLMILCQDRHCSVLHGNMVYLIV